MGERTRTLPRVVEGQRAGPCRRIYSRERDANAKKAEACRAVADALAFPKCRVPFKSEGSECGTHSFGSYPRADVPNLVLKPERLLGVPQETAPILVPDVAPQERIRAPH